MFSLSRSSKSVFTTTNQLWARRSACRNLILLLAILTMAPAKSTTSEALTSSSSSSSSRLNTEQSYKTDVARGVPTTKNSGFRTPPPLLSNGYKSRILQRGDTIIEELMKQHDVDHHPEVPVNFIADTKLPTDIGQFNLRAYRVQKNANGKSSNTNHNSKFHGDEPCVIYAADKPPFGKNGKLKENVPVRIHDQCVTSEVFRSQRCDCKEQLVMSLEYIHKNGGAIIYLQQEGRGIGLANKVAAYELQDMGMDTVDANLHLGLPEDNRQYGVVPSMLKDMNIGSIQLLTNNPRKVERLESLGVKIENTVPVLVPKATEHNQKYLETKVKRMNHANLAKVLLTKKRSSNGFSRNNSIMIGRTRLANPVGGSLQQPRRKKSPKSKNDDEAAAANNGLSSISSLVNGNKYNADDKTSHDDVNDENSTAGVVAEKDGYCFGKKSVESAIAAVARGEMIVVVDDMDRENEGDLIMAADKCTPLDMAKIVRYSSGVICIAMEGKRMDELKLPCMVANNEDPKGTAFSVTVDATKEHGITTGISATDRAKTVQLLSDPTTTAIDFNRPGHIFPLRAREGGVLTRDGHTEAGIDFARLAGLNPCGILCEIVSEDNPAGMMRLPELKRFAKKHGLVLTSIADLAQYRKETEMV